MIPNSIVHKIIIVYPRINSMNKVLSIFHKIDVCCDSSQPVWFGITSVNKVCKRIFYINE